MTTAAVKTGGTGYAVGDILDVVGGTIAAGGTAAQLKVLTVVAGGVGSVMIENPGSYSTPPAPLTGVGVAQAGGATFNLTMSVGTPDTPTPTTFSSVVTIADPNFILSDLNVKLSILDPHLNQLSIDLIAPDGVTTVHLLQNRIDGLGAVRPGVPTPGVADQANLGELNGFLIGTTFDDSAARSIADPNAVAPYTADFRPDAGSLSIFNGMTAAQLTGTWTLVVTDVKADGAAPVQRVDGWSLRMSSYISNSGFGQDVRVITGNAAAPGTAPGSAQAPFPTVTPLSGPQGIGQGLSVAIDNTLGAYSPYEGRLYFAYNVGGGVRVAYIDDLAPGFFDPGFITNPADNTVGSRFNPTIAVDERTGTVGVMYYDSNWDTAQLRASMSFSTSVDGGDDWSDSAQFNQLKTATDAITGSTIVIQPYSGDEGIAGALGFGDQSGLVMFAGHVVPMFATNNNTATSEVATATVTIAAGPRILAGDMGYIIAPIVNDDDLTNIVTYDNTFTSDGTRQINGISITFDRPILASTFDASQVKIIYRDTITPPSQPGTLIPASNYTVVPIDNDTEFGDLPASTIGMLASEFLITFNPGAELSKVGTYSYAIGNIEGDIDGIFDNTISDNSPQIRDGVEAVPGAAITPTGVVESTQSATIAALPTGATEAGKTVTIRTSAAHGFVVGEMVTIAGVGVAGYNSPIVGGVAVPFRIVSVPSPTTFTYELTTSGLTPSGGGTAKINIVTVTTVTIHDLRRRPDGHDLGSHHPRL